VKLGKLDNAERQLELAQLAFLTPGETALNLDWGWAELAAGRGDFAKAVQTGQDVIDRYLFKGLFGPGDTSLLTSYTQEAFRRPSLLLELVPAVQTIALSDRWGERMNQLAGWYAQLGNRDQADKILSELKTMILDY
jgi:hypothetical protein